MMTTSICQFSSPVINLGPEATIYDALLLMQKKRIRRIVIASNVSYEGIVGERDIARFLEADNTDRTLDEIPLSEVKKETATILKDQKDQLNACAQRMILLNTSSVVIVDEDGHSVCIITKADLVKNFPSYYQGRYKAKDHMTRKVITCRKKDSLYFALKTMMNHEIGRLVVTDNNGTPIGIITYNTFLRNNDYFRLDKQRKARDYFLPAKAILVEELMETQLLTVEPDDDLSKATRIMAEYNISGVLVVDKQDNLSGIISLSDITKIYGEYVPS